ncbi:type II secretion system protein GspD [Aliamphritea hakodatensis]|uniref:type II secretion system protein GspD n=1 Tax=Aliamphritea hakodatensis TaxID=2895352 RepID=UPI0022FDAE9B|nr:secretin N-terminal domain-containing protein [Aliamphritea hakodatensis]
MKFSTPLRPLVLAWSLIFLSGCSMLQTEQSPTPEELAAQEAVAAKARKADEIRKQLDSNSLQAGSIFGRGDAAISQPASNKGGILSEYGFSSLSRNKSAAGNTPEEPLIPVNIEFKNVDLSTLVNVFFQDYLDTSYTILPGFKDSKVSFTYRDQATRHEFETVIVSFLELYGVRIIDTGQFIGITSASDTQNYSGNNGAFGSSFSAIKLHNIAVNDFINLARRLVDDGKKLQIVDDYNTLVVHGSSLEIEALESLKRTVDKRYFKDKRVIIYQPRFLGPDALSLLIKRYETTLGTAQKTPNLMFEAEKIKGRNALLLVCSNDYSLGLMKTFLQETDRPDSNTPQAFQYVLSNQKAAELLTTINGVVTGMYQGLERPIKIVADKASNSLITIATPEEYVGIKTLIERLDYRPFAAHIDVTIAEVSLTNRMRYGVEWFLKNTSNGIVSDANIDLGQNLDSGLSTGLVKLNSDQFLTIELLGSETDFSILSNPRILVKNETTALINVGKEISIEKSSLTTNTSGSSTQREFERKDVSISLQVTPTIGPDGLIQLSLELKDSRDGGTDSNGQPIFQKREIKTDLVAVSGQTMVIAGIMQSQDSLNENNVPGISEVPYLGKLFENTDNRGERTELIMIVTPRLVANNTQAELVSQLQLNTISEELSGQLYPVSVADNGAGS